MNTAATSREAIMHVCRVTVSEKGLQAVNMREVARDCGVALGTLYNYFPSKDALLLAAVESVWTDIFHTDGQCMDGESFTDFVGGIFRRLQKGAEKYPGFFTAHSVGFARSERAEAKDAMEHWYRHIKDGLLRALRSDGAVRADAFGEGLSEAEFVDFVFENILLSLVKGEESCGSLIKIISRSIYGAQEGKNTEDTYAGNF
ncbi:MAG: TetR/AcrR family transcriptional regulator [Candidatus Avispirillum sp.]